MISQNGPNIPGILALFDKHVYMPLKFPLTGGLTTARHGRGGRSKGYVHVYSIVDAQGHRRLAC
jgi:hypothetical protein